MAKSQTAGGMTKSTLLAELKKTEESLWEWKEKHRTLLEEIGDVVFVAEVNGPMIEVNPAGVRLFGYDSVKELIQADLARDLYANPEDRKNIELLLVKNGSVKDVEIAMKQKGGERLLVQMSATALRDQGGTVSAYRALLKDVTVLRSLEQQLLQSQKMEAIGLMAGGVAHDFNNFLTVILGNVQLGLAGVDRSHPHYEILSKIQEEGKKASAVARRLLAFSRKQPFERKVINLAEQIDNLSRMLSRLIGEDIELKIELGPGPSYVSFEEAALDQVIVNLAVNAREAMPQGGVLTLRAGTVRPDEAFCRLYPFLRRGEYVRLSVIDTGVGMEDWVLSRIFEPFFTTKPGGTGLGLAVVYGVVKQHKGYVIASSQAGKGSCFDIYFPVQEAPVSKEVGDQTKEAAPEGTETLLMAEDDPEIREMFKSFLERLGYTVLLASDGEEALRIFLAQQDKIDLVLLDAVMPRVSGPKVFGQIRAIRPALPCILLTGYGEETVRRHAAEGLEIPVLQKPIPFEELARKIREVLGRPANLKTRG